MTELNIEQERREFEAWYVKNHDAVDLSRKTDAYLDWDVDLQWNSWLAAKRAAQGSAEPVYEVLRGAGAFGRDLWEEASKDDWNAYEPRFRRIVYTAPPAPVSAEPVNSELIKTLQKMMSDWGGVFAQAIHMAQSEVESKGHDGKYWNDCRFKGLEPMRALVFSMKAAQEAQVSNVAKDIESVVNWISQLPIPTRGASAKLAILERVKQSLASAPPAKDAKDSERLDFIAANPEKQLRYSKKRWSYASLPTTEFDIFKTPREAIDAAMEKS